MISATAWARFVLLAIVAVTFAAPIARGDDAALVRVDPRVELLTIVARLSGADEYNMPNSRSPYSERVEKRFGPFRDHPAIRAYAALRADHGASFDAIPSLALHLDGVPTLKERMPFDPRPARLDARWELEPTRAFIVQLRDFATVTKAAEFFADERAFYEKTEARLAALVKEADAVPWFDAFFGAKSGATYLVIPGLLCGGGNYGAGVVFGDGSPEEIRPVLGCWKWDAEGVPVFKSDQCLPTLIHELCHSYTNPIVDRHIAELEPAATKMYPPIARVMQRMAYGTPTTVLYESMVRACVIRYLADRQGADAAKREAEEQRATGFTWVPALASRLETYANDRQRYATLDAYMPEVAKFFDATAETIVKDAATRTERAPKLVSITPTNGANDVEPSMDTMTIVFDRPMRTTSWSFVGSKENVPEFIGNPAFSSDRKTLTAKMRLVPGHTYRFSLNAPKFQGFAAADGTPLEQVDVTFTVKSF
ncbi:MAG: DUF4932 domain-containing protein [Phycisphaerales bacterium]